MKKRGTGEGVQEGEGLGERENAGGGAGRLQDMQHGRASEVKERMGPKWRSIGGKGRSEVEAMGRGPMQRNLSGERATTRE